jgi:predicted metal-dependent phosphoesterase TrpH
LIVDFHCHTTASDGGSRPAELVAMMAARGVEVFSITDHDTMAAYAELDIAALGASVIPGIEINTTYKGNEVHILGFGVPVGASAFADLLERNRRSRRLRVEAMLRQLAAAGYPLTIEMVEAQAPGGEALGRPHVAKALVAAGYVRDVQSVFETLLKRGGVGYVPSLYITPQQAIDAIAASGGIPVLAHPGRLEDDGLIDELAEAGLVGLEVFYPTHTRSQVAYYRNRARQYGLVMTAGSDFHDRRYTDRPVGVEVEREEILPFLELVAPGRIRAPLRE